MAARLLALLCALCVLSADAAPSCPNSGSSAPISCFSGSTYSAAAAVPGGGRCTCKCGTSAAVADTDYFLSSTNYQTVFAAASSATCTATACNSNFPKFCGQAQSVTPVYVSYASTLAALAPASKVIGANTICVTLQQPCFAATAGNQGTAFDNPCSAVGLTTGSMNSYYALQDNNVQGSAAVQCALGLSSLVALFPGSAILNVCTANNCNAPGAVSAAVRGGGATAFAVAALAALAL